MNVLLRYRLVRHARHLLANLPRRAVLTWRYHGPREFVSRAVLFPLRATPFARRLGLTARASDPSAGAARWYRRQGRPVAIVIPTCGPPGLVSDAVKSIRRTTRRRGVRILVCDDASAPEHMAGLERIQGVELIRGRRQAGFAANVNRGLRAVRPGEDVMLLNSDVIAHHGWLERLQYAAYREPSVGVVGPKLLYPDGTIQSAGTLRNPSAPEWFDHAYRFKSGDHPEANVSRDVLAVTGAALYIKRSAFDLLGLLDEEYGMGYEDVDYCLRAWQTGIGVLYHPSASLTHLESKTRGMVQGERELRSQQHFWSRWEAWLDQRSVRAPDGGLRIIYVTEDTGIGGGHRNVFQHLNSLAERGHHCELWSLGVRPEWFELDVPVRSFPDYGELIAALDGEEAIKVATWWNTAAPVWRASVRRGIPVYLVSDIETSYYAEDHGVHAAVRASYQSEFRFLTISGWVAGELRGMGIEPTIVSCGLELDRFTPLGRERHPGAVLALGRSNPLKNFPLTAKAYSLLPEPHPELWLFGIEPALGEPLGAKYHVAPDDVEVNELLNTATVFVQTSRHEGFCLPILEAMATGIPVVCTDAHGNRDFCRDGENCLMPAAHPAAVSQAIARVLAEPELRARLSAAGLETAAANDWSHRVDELERFFDGVAATRATVAG